MNPLESTARLLLRAAMALFVVTIVIGILNGMDIWDPGHNVLLTHVHAGTLGWITLAMVGVALLMFGGGADQKAIEGAQRMGLATVVVTTIYVIAFATGTGIFRPIAGTLMLLAIVWVLAWVWGRYTASARTTAQLAMLLTMVSLTIGAVLGVRLGLFIANGTLPGLSTEMAANLGAAHPAAMLIGYLILAGVAVTDWILEGPEGRSGRAVAWILFAAGIVMNVAFIFNLDVLIQVGSLLEVIAIVMFIVRMWSKITPSAWQGGAAADFARMSVVFLAVGIALLVYLVQLFVSGTLNPETGEGSVGVLLGFDHSMFVGVMTNALFAVVAGFGAIRSYALVMWSVNVGLAGFLLGLVLDVAILKRISAPIMGVALLAGIAVCVRQL
ncbi:hypothetical protein BH23ACT5_BH23ACT5_09350 [soil metagenome]